VGERYTLRVGAYDPEIQLDACDIEYRGELGKFTACENVAEELQAEMIDRLNADPAEIRADERAKVIAEVREAIEAVEVEIAAPPSGRFVRDGEQVKNWILRLFDSPGARFGQKEGT
jgi:hypothetical protein